MAFKKTVSYADWIVENNTEMSLHADWFDAVFICLLIGIFSAQEIQKRGLFTSLQWVL